MPYFILYKIFYQMKSLILITKCVILNEISKENWDVDKLPGVERVKQRKCWVKRALNNIIFIFFILEALLKCYDCKSSFGWGTCPKKEILCNINQERCIKVYRKVGDLKSFTKTCARITECNARSSHYCRSGTQSSTCNIDCCRTDRCNVGSRVGTNLLLVGAVISFIFILLGLA